MVIADLPRLRDCASKFRWRSVEVYESGEHCSLSLEIDDVQPPPSAVFQRTPLSPREASLRDANVIGALRCSWHIHTESAEQCSIGSVLPLHGSGAMSLAPRAIRIPAQCLPDRAR